MQSQNCPAVIRASANLLHHGHEWCSMVTARNYAAVSASMVMWAVCKATDSISNCWRSVCETGQICFQSNEFCHNFEIFTEADRRWSADRCWMTLQMCERASREVNTLNLLFNLQTVRQLESIFFFCRWHSFSCHLEMENCQQKNQFTACFKTCQQTHRWIQALWTEMWSLNV